MQWQVDLRLTAAVQAELADAYRSGTPTTTLCVEYHLSKTSVLKILGEAGVPMRRQPMTDDRVVDAIRLYRDGQSLAQIGRRMGVAKNSVRCSKPESSSDHQPVGNSDLLLDSRSFRPTDSSHFCNRRLVSAAAHLQDGHRSLWVPRFRRTTQRAPMPA